MELFECYKAEDKVVQLRKYLQICIGKPNILRMRLSYVQEFLDKQEKAKNEEIDALKDLLRLSKRKLLRRQ